MRPTCRAGTATACRSRLAIEKKFGKVGDKLDAAAVPREVPRIRRRADRPAARAISSAWACSATGSNPYRTMDFGYEADMLRALAKIIERGHLARGVKPVHWCFDCGSALAEAEIEYQDKALARGRRRLRRAAAAGAGRRVRRGVARRRRRRRADLDHHAVDAAGEPRGDARPGTRLRAGRRPGARRTPAVAGARRSARGSARCSATASTTSSCSARAPGVDARRPATAASVL